MSAAQELVTRLTLDSKQFNLGISSAEKKVGSFSESTIKSFSYTNAAIGLLGTAAVYKFGDAIISVISDIGALYDKTQSLGISVSRFQELALAAGEAGVSQDTLTNSLSKMQKTIGNASIGVKESVQALGLLGLTYKNLQDLDPQQQFLLIGERISQVKDRSLQAALATKTLGRSGAESLGFFNSNMKESIDSASKLGFTLSNLQASNLDHLGESSARLWETFKGKGTQIIADIAPGIESIGNMLVSVVGRINTSVNNMIQSIAKGVRKGAYAFADLLPRGDVSDVEKFLSGLNKATGGSLNSLSDQATSKRLSDPKVDRGVGKLNVSELTAKAVNDSLPKLTDASVQAKQAIYDLGNSAKSASDKFKMVQNSIDAPGQQQASDLFAQANKRFTGSSGRDVNGLLGSSPIQELPAAQSEKFIALLKDSINNPNNGKSNIDNLERIAKGVNSQVEDNRGMLTAIQELKGFLEQQTQKPAEVSLKVTVDVAPSPDFVAKVVTSQDFTKAQKAAMYQEWGNIARSIGNR